MSSPDLAEIEQRILVIAPTGRDAANSLAFFSKAGLTCAACGNVVELCQEIAAGAGLVVLTEECLSLERASLLMETLRTQPAWSDLPIIVLTRGGQESQVAIRAMRTLGNVILLERPVRVFTLITAAKAALRGRNKQYQIRSQMNEFRRADERKDEFLATLAHELRNPLAPVRNGLQIIRAKGELTGETAAVRDMMERQVGHMVRLIDDLMDVSRITRGKVELKKERLDFRQVLESALESSRPLMEAAHHEFTVALPGGSLPIDGDLTRLAQVLANLLNNSTKYTPDGGTIKVSGTVDGPMLLIQIQDNGMGIPAEMLPDIFEMFTQVGRTIDRAQGGLGIGLTLVRRLVEMHGGIITAESEGIGQGSTFNIRLPLVPNAATHDSATDGESTASDTPHPSLRVLVVDDNVDGAESLALMLKMSGYATTTAYHGAAAIAAAETFRPEVVFLDIGLPGMNGYDVARRLREHPDHQTTVLVALTGWGSEDDKKQATAAGFDHHLTKPADAVLVERILAELAATAGSRTSPQSRTGQ